jgi:uncharacterized protein (DUF885 family)
MTQKLPSAMRLPSALLAVLISGPCLIAADQDELSSPQSPLRGHIERFQADRDSVANVFTVSLSSERRSRFEQLYRDWLGVLERLDFDGLGQDGRIDYILFQNYLAHELRQLGLDARAQDEASALVPFAPKILELEEHRRHFEPVDPAAMAGQLNQLKKQVDEVRRSVEAALGTAEPPGELSRLVAKKTLVNRAAGYVHRLSNALGEWFTFYNGYDPIFTWWVAEPHQALRTSLQDYATFLRERVVGVKQKDDKAIVGDPIGREGLMSELAYAMIPYTPEELIAIAEREFAWCETEMRRASQELGYGDDWLRALEHVKTLYVEPGKQPQLIHDLALEAIAFLDEHDLVTVPQLARDSWRMEMMTPERQLQTPFFTGGEVISVSFPTNSMEHEAKLMSLRGNNIHFSRATVHHELIPGHHLQAFMTSRYRTYRSLFGTPFWGEGWALYWEMLLWDLHFAKSPENEIGMLFWRMHRCARIIFSLSFHLEKMTPDECIDFLVKRVGHERDNASAEVRRSFSGSYSPLYQCAYMLGGLQIRALHRELVDSGKMTNRAFHDAILKENSIPIEMVRASLTKQPLSRDFASSWKFYGELASGR